MRAQKQVSNKLAKLMGGATGSLPKAVQRLGTWEHDDARIVDEEIVRVWSYFNPAKFAEDVYHEELRPLIRQIATDLDQDAVFVVRDGRIDLVEGTGCGKPPARLAFRSLESWRRNQFLYLAWLEIRRPEDIRTLLELDGWESGTPSEQGDPISRKGRRVVVLGAPPEDPSPARSWTLYVGGQEDGLTIALDHRGRRYGPRQFPLPTGREDASVPPRLRVLSGALLGVSPEHVLHEVLDRNALTLRFYREYHDLSKAVEASDTTASDPVEKRRRARLLLNRYLFLRFVENLDWARRCGLSATPQQNVRSPRAIQRHLKRTLSLLSTPIELRRRAHTIPYLDGGLFREDLGALLGQLDPSLLDPSCPQSIPRVFGAYDFFLESEHSATDRLGINPEVFGNVLQALCSADERKQGGIHYTPPLIGRTLAREGLLPLVAKRAGISAKGLDCFEVGDVHALSEADAERASEAILELRILDPAVGSGSLLVACLQFLLDLYTGLQARAGVDIARGKFKWRQACRRLVQDVLHGVDLDARAVDITRLRLWLMLAVGAESPEELPSLSYNIRVGDSLTPVHTQDTIRAELDSLSESQADLPLDRVSGALHEMRSSLRRRRDAISRGDWESMEKAEAEQSEAETRFWDAWEHEHGLPDGLRKGGDVTPFLWSVHFLSVLQKPRCGFDFVIANPPYVRAERQDEADRTALAANYETARKGKTDLYQVFVEQALNLLAPGGKLAFVLPNFARTDAAAGLRLLLRRKARIDRWLDFGDLPVFPTSTTYSALLFATRTRSQARTFNAGKVSRSVWSKAQGSRQPLALAVKTFRVPHSEHGQEWLVVPRVHAGNLARLAGEHPSLGDLFEIHVGIQTGRNEVYLGSIQDDRNSDLVRFTPDTKGERSTLLEAAALRPILKGSKDLKPHRATHGRRVVWPYDGAGNLIPELELRERFPRSLAYLRRHKSALLGRSQTSSDGWWAFNRRQGQAVASQRKILVPSLCHVATAFLDEAGAYAITASGAGGGGAYALVPKTRMGKALLSWYALVLNSSLCTYVLMMRGEPKRGGWLGLDRGVLKSIPLPPMPKSTTRRVLRLQCGLAGSSTSEAGRARSQDEVDRMVSAAVDLDCTRLVSQLTDS